MSAPDISIVIVSYNTRDILRECLQSVFKCTTGGAFEVVVVDNASIDGSVAMVCDEFPQVRVLALEKNIGFGRGNNAGVEVAQGRYLFLLNSDAILQGNTAVLLAQYLSLHADVACVGPRIIMSGGAVQPKAFGHLPSPWRMLMQSTGLGYLGVPIFEGVDGVWRGAGEMEVGWLSGVCLCLRRDDYLAVGGFDARFFMYCEDIALCANLHRTKGRVMLLDSFDVLHYGGASSSNSQRNAVWQQRHILQVCQDEYGSLARAMSVYFVICGLLLRLILGLMLIPAKGRARNVMLNCAWYRLLDILGFHIAQSAISENQHANRH